jgi:hypothetical protein
MATSPYYLLAEHGTIHRLARSAFYGLILGSRREEPAFSLDAEQRAELRPAT